MNPEFQPFSAWDEDTQEAILNANRDFNIDHDWWDYVYEDAKTIGSLIGIEIDRIYFSGFWSQGDGACFDGTYSYTKGGLKALKAHASQDTELLSIAERLQLVQRQAFYGLSARVNQSGHYMHSGCTHIDGESEHVTSLSWERSKVDDLIDDMSDLLREFMDWIYNRLEVEHDYLTGEGLREYLSESDMLFNETGEWKWDEAA